MVLPEGEPAIAILYSYDSLPSAVKLANGSRFMRQLLRGRAAIMKSLHVRISPLSIVLRYKCNHVELWLTSLLWLSSVTVKERE